MIKPQRYENPNIPEQTFKYALWPSDKGKTLIPMAGGEGRAG